jgi:preprotein translocase subunit SecE
VTKAKVTKKKENAIVRYLRDTRSELRKVHWPSRDEAWSLTKVVMAVTVSMAAFLGFLDYLFSLELKGIIEGNAIAIGALLVVVVAGALFVVFQRRQATR